MFQAFEYLNHDLKGLEANKSVGLKPFKAPSMPFTASSSPSKA